MFVFCEVKRILGNGQGGGGVTFEVMERVLEMSIFVQINR